MESVDALSTLRLDKSACRSGESVDVRQQREVPEPWAGAMKRKRLTDPRTGQPSVSALSAAAGPAVQTCIRLIFGPGKPDPATVKAVAAALDEDVATISTWARLARPVAGPYEPPTEAAFLDERQRAALDELIRAMAAAQAAPAVRVDDYGLAAREGVTDLPPPPDDEGA
jgi:hypothetical protein